LSGEENYLKDLIKEIFKRIVIKKSKNGISIDNTMLLSYNLALRRRFLKFLMPALGYDNIEKILEMSENKTVGTISLTKNLLANMEYDRIYLGKPVKKPVNRNVSVPIGKSFAVSDMEIEVQTSLNPVNLNLATKDSNTEIFDYDKLTPPFYLRYRQPGDRFTPFGGSEKKLKEVLIDDKIPERVRARLPLFCDREGILWILGSRRAERARIKPETKKFLTVRIEPWKNQPRRID
jgi:tRNA(Ile)-lysidine synthase